MLASSYSSLFAWAVLGCILAVRVSGFNEVRFRRVIERMEDDVLDLKAEIERLYAKRCSEDTLTNCGRSVQSHCSSSLAGTSCQGSSALSNPVCGQGKQCGTIYSYEHSVVVLHSSLQSGVDGNPTDPRVIESICSTQELDEYFVEKFESSREEWAEFGVDPAWMQFGAHNGAYRFFPGQQTSDCYFFDPRNRPWYLAASTGPKNIVLLLDTSGSMDTGDRLVLMKRAAIRVVDSLSVGDRVALVPFDKEPNVVADIGTEGESILFKATNTNKAILKEEIDKLEANGSTNFLDTFRTTFDLLEISVGVERTVNCNTAILFLTDGEMTEPEDATGPQVIELVNNGIDRLKDELGHSVILFTYSVSEDEKVHVFPKELACATGDGIWSLINDEQEILESLKSYSDLFSLGIGSGVNEDFTTFVEPYNFFDVENVVGVTVSAPVFDKSKTPHLFLGVAGVDILVSALDRALEVPTGSNLTLELLEERSTAKCPTIDLTHCERESFRRRGITRVNNDALCTDNCTIDDFVVVEEQQCPTASDLPSYLWTDNLGLDTAAEDRLCCNLDDPLFLAPGSCLATTSGLSKQWLISTMLGGVAAALVLVVALSVLFFRRQSSGGIGRFADSSIIPLPPPPLNPAFVPPPTESQYATRFSKFGNSST